jgi:hypothetical protein
MGQRGVSEGWRGASRLHGEARRSSGGGARWHSFIQFPPAAAMAELRPRMRRCVLRA